MINLSQRLILHIQGITLDFDNNFFNIKPVHYFQEPEFDIRTSKVIRTCNRKGEILYKSNDKICSTTVDVDIQFDNIVITFILDQQELSDISIDELNIITFILPIKAKSKGEVYLYQNGNLLSHYDFLSSTVTFTNVEYSKLQLSGKT